MIRDYWIFQQRETSVPWALYVVKEYSNPQRFETTCLDVCIYSEDIPNNEHSLTFVCWQFDSIDGYIDELEKHISTFSDFVQEDRLQLETAIFKILVDSK